MRKIISLDCVQQWFNVVNNVQDSLYQSTFSELSNRKALNKFLISYSIYVSKHFIFLNWMKMNKIFILQPSGNDRL